MKRADVRIKVSPVVQWLWDLPTCRTCGTGLEPLERAHGVRCPKCRWSLEYKHSRADRIWFSLDGWVKWGVLAVWVSTVLQATAWLIRLVVGP